MYEYTVGVEAGYTCSQCDDQTDTDVEKDDAYVSGQQPLLPGATYFGTAISFTCDNADAGDDYFDPSRCDSDISLYITFIAGVPSITNITPTSDVAGNSGQITIQGQYLGDPFGGGYTSAAITGPNGSSQGVVLSGGSSSSDVTTYTVNYAINQNASPGTYYLTVTNPFGTSNQASFYVNHASASISGFSPPDPWTAGTSFPVTITGSNFGSNPSVSVSGVGVSSGSAYNSDPGGTSTQVYVTIDSTAPSEVATITVTPSAPSGCTGNCFGQGGSAPPDGQNSIGAQIGGTAGTCPKSLKLLSNTGSVEPLSSIFPDYKTGIGAVFSFDVSDSTGTIYDQTPIQEAITTNSNTCSIKLCQASGGLVVGQGGTLQDNAHLSGVQNALYDETAYSSASVRQTSGSCSASCTQVISCGGKTLGTFTNSWTLTPSTISSTPVTNVVVTKK